MTRDVNLEKNPLLKLQVCECRKLHLTYGSLTLHFEKDEFMAYVACLSRMAAQLQKLPFERFVPLMRDLYRKDSN